FCAVSFSWPSHFIQLGFLSPLCSDQLEDLSLWSSSNTSSQEQIDIVFWECGPNTTLKYVPHKDTVTVFTHKGRVEFNKETFSLELKNLQKSDSGLYRGKISAGTEVIVEHTLS
ncbi:hypothetical protein AALO_G00013130, partial [Alosa alosa]